MAEVSARHESCVIPKSPGFLQRGESLPWATEAKQKESNGDLARGTNIPPTCTIPVKTRN